MLWGRGASTPACCRRASDSAPHGGWIRVRRDRVCFPAGRWRGRVADHAERRPTVTAVSSEKTRIPRGRFRAAAATRQRRGCRQAHGTDPADRGRGARHRDRWHAHSRGRVRPAAAW